MVNSLFTTYQSWHDGFIHLLIVEPAAIKKVSLLKYNELNKSHAFGFMYLLSASHDRTYS